MGDMSVAQLVKELANICLVKILMLCHLKFNIPVHKQKLLAKVFLLPSVKILHRSVTKLKIYPGFNKALLDTIKIKANVMADQMKFWCIVFNELAIKENISYNPEHDEVEDFGDVGNVLYFASHCVYVETFSM